MILLVKLNDYSMRVCNDSLSFPELMVTTSSSSGLLLVSVATLSATVLLGLSFNLRDFLIALVHIFMNLLTGSNSPSGSSTSSALTNSLLGCLSWAVLYSLQLDNASATWFLSPPTCMVS